MFGFTLLNSAFLAGLAAVAIPIIIHLVYRRKSKVVLFPDLRFLKQVDQRISRRHKVEEWILLLCRMAVIALLALALAKPLWKSEGHTIGAGPSTAAILVLDDSYSMEFTQGGLAAFDRAKKGALAAHSLLHRGDSVAVLTLNRIPERGKVILSTDLVAARETIEALTPSKGTSNVAPALARACELLAPSTCTYRDIYLFTDLQKNGWEGVLTSEEWKGRLKNFSFFLVDAGRPQGPNLALTGVEIASAHEIRGVPARAAVTVENPGDVPASSSVSLLLDGRRVQDRHVAVPAGGSALVALSAPCDGIGFHRGEVTLDDDAIAADNHRYFAIEVRESIRVLLVNGNVSPVPHLDGAFYLAKALNPGAAHEEKQSIIATTTCPAAELGDYALADFSVIVLAEVGALPPDRVAAVADFVERGGGLLILCGPGADPAVVTRTWNTRGPFGPLLPAPVTEVRGEANRHDQFTTLREVSERHPVFAALLGADPPVDLGSARFYRNAVIPVKTDTRDVVCVARFANGDPALLEKRYGTGKVLLFAAPANMAWSNFPLKVGFLPFVHNLIYYLSGTERARENYVVGRPLRLPYPKKAALKQVALAAPGAEPVVRAPQPDATGSAVVFEAVQEPGVYDLAEELESGRRESMIAVNVDSSESDLARVEPEQVAKALGGDRCTYVKSCDEVVATVTRRRSGIELTDLLLFLALGALLFEGYYANRIAFGK